jgi:hypothetical protein
VLDSHHVDRIRDGSEPELALPASKRVDRRKQDPLLPHQVRLHFRSDGGNQLPYVCELGMSAFVRSEHLLGQRVEER